jgi:hypothetical protein
MEAHNARDGRGLGRQGGVVEVPDDPCPATIRRTAGPQGHSPRAGGRRRSACFAQGRGLHLPAQPNLYTALQLRLEIAHAVPWRLSR